MRYAITIPGFKAISDEHHVTYNKLSVIFNCGRSALEIFFQLSQQFTVPLSPLSRQGPWPLLVGQGGRGEGGGKYSGVLGTIHYQKECWQVMGVM